MISKKEMKTYFLKANYNALKSEFKHEFHETSYFKPTFCALCDGLLWGLIKQGWKCKDCGISAHRLCKDRVVIECRPKRNININNRNLNSSTDLSNNIRSVSNRSRNRKKISYKQKGTQTDIYDDLFMSDESLSSNDDNDNLDKSNEFNEGKAYRLISCENVSTSTNLNESTEQIIHHTHRTRRNLNKKSPKRRKSLPSHKSYNTSSNTVTLIPRGPLICSNNENIENWLPKKFLYSNAPILVKLDNSNDNCGEFKNNKIVAPPETLYLTSNQSENKTMKHQLIEPSLAAHKSNDLSKFMINLSETRDINFSDSGINNCNENLIDDTFSSNDEDNEVFIKFKEDEV